MLPSTIHGLLIAIAFLIPGLILEFGIEQQVSYRRTSLADRWLRFFLESTVYQFAFAWFGFAMWKDLRGTKLETVNDFPTRAYLLTFFVYIVLPLLIGTLVGYCARKGKAGFLVNLIVGIDALPQAWDHIFSNVTTFGFVRARMKDGRWLAGIYGQTGPIGAFASSFPEDQDVYLPVQLAIDPLTGDLVKDEDNNAIHIHWGVHLRRSDIDIFEFQSS